MLVRGSNLDAALPDSGINLTDRGLQRNRITWICEMDKDELRRQSHAEPTVDGIEIEEFETPDELRDWLQKTAPSFLRLTEKR